MDAWMPGDGFVGLAVHANRVLHAYTQTGMHTTPLPWPTQFSIGQRLMFGLVDTRVCKTCNMATDILRER